MRQRPADEVGASTVATSPSTGRRPGVSINDDNRFFFDALGRGELRFQQCPSCHQITHPPTPMCPACGSFERGTVASSGRGEVYSFIVNHHPQVPGFTYPLVVALVELDEGVRMVTNLVGVAPDEVHIGLPVELEVVVVDGDQVLPLFRPISRPMSTDDGTAAP